jgi:hypothetical protein
MSSLLELPMKAAAFAARTSMHLIEAAAEAAAQRFRGGSARPMPDPPPSRNPDPAPPPVRRRRPPAAAPAAAAPPPPAPAAAPPVPAPAPVPPDEPPLTVVPEPTRGQAARIRTERREAETTDDSPGAQIRVDEPWPGYASMNAPEIIDRVRTSDEAVKAVVLLYERSHRARKTVLQAAGG